MTRGFTVPRWMLRLFPPYLLAKVRNNGLAWSAQRLPSYLVRLALDLSLLPLAILIRLVLVALKPFVHIRIGRLWCDRLGPYAILPELYLCEQNAGLKPSKDFEVWYHYDRDAYMLQNRVSPRQAICNQQLNTMWERVFHVHDVARYLDSLNRMLGFGSKDFIVDMATEMADREDLLDRFPTHLAFTEAEEELGLRELQKLGIGPDDKFVCFHGRDSVYLNRARPRNVKAHGDWTRHNARDVSIHDYVPAAEDLTELGYFTVRMGKYVAEPLSTTNPKIIDYASRSQSDFMDVFLSARCSFFIGQNSGMVSISQIFRKPLVLVNIYPIGDLIYYSEYQNGLAIPKKHYSNERRRVLTMRETFDLGLGKPAQQTVQQKCVADTLGIQVIDNNPEEIQIAVMEMHDRLELRPDRTDKNKQLQAKFWSIVREGLDAFHSPYLSETPNLAIGAQYLHANKDWLE